MVKKDFRSWIRGTGKEKYSYFILIWYIIIQAYLYLNFTLVPDEVMFLDYCRDMFAKANTSFVGFIIACIKQENFLGYGSLFWIILSVLQVFGSGSIIIFRLLVLALAFYGLKVFNDHSHPNARILRITFILSSACMWWYGKIISPELISVYVGFIGLFFCYNKNRNFGWLLLGISIGLKPTSILFGLFAFCTDLRFEGSYFKSPVLVRRALFIVAGFFIANPFFILNPSLYLANLKTATAHSGFYSAHLIEIFFGSRWEWDVVFSGSFFNWILHPVTFLGIILLIIIGKLPRNLVFALAIAAFVCALILLSNARFLGWYWLPLLFILFYTLTKLDFNQKWTRELLIALVIIQLCTNADTIYGEVDNRLEHTANLKTRKQIFMCAREKVLSMNPSSIVDFSEVQEPLGFDSIPQIHGVRAYNWLNNPDSLEVMPKPIVVIVGDRLMRRKKFADLESYLIKRNRRLKLRVIKRCGWARFFYIEELPQRN